MEKTLTLPPMASQVVTMVKNLPANVGDKEITVQSLGGEDHLQQENSSSLQYTWLENLMDKRSLEGCNPWGPKESDMIKHMQPLQPMVLYLVTGIIVILCRDYQRDDQVYWRMYSIWISIVYQWEVANPSWRNYSN